MLRILNWLAPVMFLMVSLTGAAADNARGVSGVWEGTGIQGEYTWSMRVTFAPDTDRIDYPSLECGGYWETAPLASAPESEAFFHERLEYGHHACHADGYVRIRVTPSGIEYEWSRSKGAPVEATALLRPGKK